MKVLIVEDERLYAGHIKLLVEDLGYEVVGLADSADEALALADRQPPELLIMDITIAGAYDGIETADLIRRSHPCAVIFVTARQDEQTFLRARRLGPANFLLKPFDDLQLRRAIQLATAGAPPEPATDADKRDQASRDDENLYVKIGYQLRKVPLADITSVAADGSYCAIHTVTNRYLVRQSLRQLTERLPAHRFLKTHRSHLVNEAFVESVNLRDSEILLRGGQRVPLAKREREAFLKRIEK